MQIQPTRSTERLKTSFSTTRSARKESRSPTLFQQMLNNEKSYMQHLQQSQNRFNTPNSTTVMTERTTILLYDRALTESKYTTPNRHRKIIQTEVIPHLPSLTESLRIQETPPRFRKARSISVKEFAKSRPRSVEGSESPQQDVEVKSRSISRSISRANSLLKLNSLREQLGFSQMFRRMDLDTNESQKGAKNIVLLLRLMKEFLRISHTMKEIRTNSDVLTPNVQVLKDIKEGIQKSLTEYENNGGIDDTGPGASALEFKISLLPATTKNNGNDDLETSIQQLEMMKGEFLQSLDHYMCKTPGDSGTSSPGLMSPSNQKKNFEARLFAFLRGFTDLLLIIANDQITKTKFLATLFTTKPNEEDDLVLNPAQALQVILIDSQKKFEECPGVLFELRKIIQQSLAILIKMIDIICETNLSNVKRIITMPFEKVLHVPEPHQIYLEKLLKKFGVVIRGIKNLKILQDVEKGYLAEIIMAQEILQEQLEFSVDEKCEREKYEEIKTKIEEINDNRRKLYILQDHLRQILKTQLQSNQIKLSLGKIEQLIIKLDNKSKQCHTIQIAFAKEVISRYDTIIKEIHKISQSLALFVTTHVTKDKRYFNFENSLNFPVSIQTHKDQMQAQILQLGFFKRHYQNIHDSVITLNPSIDEIESTITNFDNKILVLENVLYFQELFVPSNIEFVFKGLASFELRTYFTKLWQQYREKVPEVAFHEEMKKTADMGILHEFLSDNKKMETKLLEFVQDVRNFSTNIEKIYDNGSNFGVVFADKLEKISIEHFAEFERFISSFGKGSRKLEYIDKFVEFLERMGAKEQKEIENICKLAKLSEQNIENSSKLIEKRTTTMNKLIEIIDINEEFSPILNRAIEKITKNIESLYKILTILTYLPLFIKDQIQAQIASLKQNLAKLKALSRFLTTLGDFSQISLETAVTTRKVFDWNAIMASIVKVNHAVERAEEFISIPVITQMVEILHEICNHFLTTNASISSINKKSAPNLLQYLNIICAKYKQVVTQSKRSLTKFDTFEHYETRIPKIMRMFHKKHLEEITAKLQSVLEFIENLDPLLTDFRSNFCTNGELDLDKLSGDSDNLEYMSELEEFTKTIILKRQILCEFMDFYLVLNNEYLQKELIIRMNMLDVIENNLKIYLRCSKFVVDYKLKIEENFSEKITFTKSPDEILLIIDTIIQSITVFKLGLVKFMPDSEFAQNMLTLTNHFCLENIKWLEAARSYFIDIIKSVKHINENAFAHNLNIPEAFNTLSTNYNKYQTFPIYAGPEAYFNKIIDNIGDVIETFNCNLKTEFAEPRVEVLSILQEYIEMVESWVRDIEGKTEYSSKFVEEIDLFIIEVMQPSSKITLAEMEKQVWKYLDIYQRIEDRSEWLKNKRNYKILDLQNVEIVDKAVEKWLNCDRVKNWMLFFNALSVGVFQNRSEFEKMELKHVEDFKDYLGRQMNYNSKFNRFLNEVYVLLECIFMNMLLK